MVAKRLAQSFFCLVVFVGLAWLVNPEQTSRSISAVGHGPPDQSVQQDIVAAPRSASNTTSRTDRPAGDQRKYFPYEIGIRWEYTIVKGEREPLSYTETRWPTGKGSELRATRGRFYRLMAAESQTNFKLIVRVDEYASKQGFLEYPSGVKLAVERDDLGVFEHASSVYYAISTSTGFEVLQVVEYPPSSPGSPPGARRDQGHALRFVFMADQPWIQKGLGENPRDTFLSRGVDTSVPGYLGQPLLHFVRTVEAAKKDPGEKTSVLDSKFTEDVWFARGKGLVRLEQKVEGVPSMVWVLSSFSKP